MSKKLKQVDEKSKFARIERSMVEEISYFLFALGNKFVQIQNAEAAFDCFKYSIDLNPRHQPSVYNLGALYNIMGNLDGAYRMFKESSRMKPSDLVSRTALGEVSRKLNKLDESREILDAVYKEDPENYMILSAMAILHYDCGRLAEAMEWNERALEKKPGDMHMVLNRALINMTFGRWEDWWNQYEFCLSYQKNERMKGMRMSDAWAGQEFPGKTILIISDQGSGDAVQFSRYIREVKDRGKFEKVIYLVQPDMKEILSRVDGVDQVVGFGEKMNLEFDVFSSLLGVMRVLQISPANCWRPPHVSTNPRLDQIWKHRIGGHWDGESKKVGLAWAGDPKHGNDHARSFQLSQYAKLLTGTESFPGVIMGVQFFSFQVGKPADQLKTLPSHEVGSIVDLGQEFRNFDDTASALRQMDLLITCDTSVAHLAGCLGIPAWILVPNPPEWRWLTDVTVTQWYNNARIYRQRTPKNWDTVIEAVAKDLHEFSRR